MQVASVAKGSSFVPVVRLGTGGMGFIELCGHVERQRIRWLAQKRMHPELRQDPDLRTMFEDEGRVGVLLQHPNVVRVFGTGEDARGPYLNMEYVEGLPLSALLRKATRTGRPIPIHIAIRICRDIALGLHAAHELRAPDGTWLWLVHRDVSPNNVLVGFDGSVRLTDFGIAKGVASPSETCPGVVKGTRGYLSPEQLRGEQVDRRSDLFSLGVILHELLAGARLYGGRHTEARRRLLAEPPPDIRRLAPAAEPLAPLLERLLAKRPEGRPATALDVVAALDALVPRPVHLDSSFQVAGYMARHFAGKRARIRALLADKREQLKSGTPGPLDATPPPVSRTATTQHALPAVSRRALPAWPTLGGATVVIVAMLTLIAARRPAATVVNGRPAVACAAPSRRPDIVPLPVATPSPVLVPRAPHKRAGAPRARGASRAHAAHRVTRAAT